MMSPFHFKNYSKASLLWDYFDPLAVEATAFDSREIRALRLNSMYLSDPENCFDIEEEDLLKCAAIADLFPRLFCLGKVVQWPSKATYAKLTDAFLKGELGDSFEGAELEDAVVKFLKDEPIQPVADQPQQDVLYRKLYQRVADKRMFETDAVAHSLRNMVLNRRWVSPVSEALSKHPEAGPGKHKKAPEFIYLSPLPIKAVYALQSFNASLIGMDPAGANVNYILQGLALLGYIPSAKCIHAPKHMQDILSKAKRSEVTIGNIGPLGKAIHQVKDLALKKGLLQKFDIWTRIMERWGWQNELEYNYLEYHTRVIQQSCVDSEFPIHRIDISKAMLTLLAKGNVVLPPGRIAFTKQNPVGRIVKASSPCKNSALDHDITTMAGVIKAAVGKHQLVVSDRSKECAVWCKSMGFEFTTDTTEMRSDAKRFLTNQVWPPLAMENVLKQFSKQMVRDTYIYESQGDQFRNNLVEYGIVDTTPVADYFDSDIKLPKLTDEYDSIMESLKNAVDMSTPDTGSTDWWNKTGGLFNNKPPELPKPPAKTSKVPLTMPAIHKALDRKVLGQTQAKRAIAHAVFVLGLLNAETGRGRRAVEVPNILLRGPSGSGKTLVANQIAKILGWKFKTIDCTTLTAEGYYGKSLSNEAKDIEDTVVFLDEIDKIIQPKKDGGSNTSTEAVQYELLTLLEKQYSNVNCLFVAAGSFANTDKDLIPELKGRLPVVCHLDAPEEKDFVVAAEKFEIPKVKALIKLMGNHLPKVTIDVATAESIGKMAFQVYQKRGTGFRALSTITHQLNMALSHETENTEERELIINVDYLKSHCKEVEELK